jgi:hypothetical protein
MIYDYIINNCYNYDYYHHLMNIPRKFANSCYIQVHQPDFPCNYYLILICLKLVTGKLVTSILSQILLILHVATISIRVCPLSQFDCLSFRDKAYSHLSGFMNKQNTRFTAPEIPHIQWDIPPSCKMYMWCAISKQDFTSLILVDNTITSVWYLQQLHNKATLLIQRASHMDTTFSQQDGAQSHIVNVILDILHDMSGRYIDMSCSLGLQSAAGVGNPGNHLFCQWIPTIIYSGANTKVVCSAQTSMFEIYKRKLKLLLKISQVICCVTWITALWFTYRKYMRLHNVMMNMCSHRDHKHTNSQWKLALFHIPHKIMYTPHIHLYCCMFL